MFCSSCGSEIGTDAVYCPRCGRHLNAGDPTVNIGATAAMAVGLGAVRSNLFTASDTGIRYAGFWRRFGAMLIDGIVLTVAIFGVDVASFVVRDMFSTLTLGGYIHAVAFVSVLIAGPWLYYSLMESSPYQATFGKQAAGIIVTDELGNRLSFGRATGRYLAKSISYLTFFVGFIMAGFTKKKQTLHDVIAGTLVVIKSEA